MSCAGGSGSIARAMPANDAMAATETDATSKAVAANLRVISFSFVAANLIDVGRNFQSGLRHPAAS
jgi:hypothetical protein